MADCAMGWVYDNPMKSIKAIALATLAAALLGVPVPTAEATTTSATAGSPANFTWLAAGDSYASGAGLPKTTSPCAQGTGKDGLSSTWSVVAAKILSREGWKFIKGEPDVVACTGAISDEFFHDHTGLVGGSHPQQWNEAMGSDNLVSLSFGGDDLGFASIIQHCLSTGCPPDSAVRAKIRQLATTGVYKGSLHIPSLPVFLNHVANTAVTSSGDVIVMGYPEIFEDPFLWPSALKLLKDCQGFTPGQVALIRGWAGDLNATLGNVVAQVNSEPAGERDNVRFTFINPVTGQSTLGVPFSDPNLFEPSQGTRHELCSDGDQAWLNGFTPSSITRSFHPNQAGNNAMGELVASAITGLYPATSALGALVGEYYVHDGSLVIRADGRATLSSPDYTLSNVSLYSSIYTLQIKLSPIGKNVARGIILSSTTSKVRVGSTFTVRTGGYGAIIQGLGLGFDFCTWPQNYGKCGA